MYGKWNVSKEGMDTFILLYTHTHPAMVFIKIVLSWSCKKKKYFRVYGKVILEVERASLEGILHLSCFLSCLIKKMSLI